MRKYPGQADLSVSPREENIRRIARRAAAEGMVLLENDGVLALKEGAKLALFGQGARYTIKGGTGSGDVNSRNTITVDMGLRNAGFTIVNSAYLDGYDAAFAESKRQCEEAVYREAGEDRDPMKFYKAHATFAPQPPEIPVDAKDVEGADAAVYVISRVSGEFADRRAEKGDYYLNDREEAELETLCGFGIPVIVLLNVGGVMDLGFLEKRKISAVVLMSQPGSEGGNALADVLSGKVNFSGRLTDTWAYRQRGVLSPEREPDGGILYGRYLRRIPVFHQLRRETPLSLRIRFGLHFLHGGSLRRGAAGGQGPRFRQGEEYGERRGETGRTAVRRVSFGRADDGTAAAGCLRQDRRTGARGGGNGDPALLDPAAVILP